MTSSETPKLGASGLVVGGAAVAVALGVFGWWMSQDSPVEVAEDPIAKVTAEPAERDAAQEQMAETEAVIIPKVAAPIKSPHFDVVRVEPDGSTVVAGQAEPGAQVDLILDGQQVGTTQADASGNFVAMLTLDPSDAPRVMTLMGDGAAVNASEQSVIVGPTEGLKPAIETAATTEVLVSPDADNKVETSATEVATEAPVEPQGAPQVLLADEDGISVIQDAGGAANTSDISLDSISYDHKGQVALAGRGSGQDRVLIYLDDVKVAEGVIANTGQWQVTLNDVAAGIYTLRIDALDAASKLTSRLETPFKREDPTQLAALSQKQETVAADLATAPFAESASSVTSEVASRVEATKDETEGVAGASGIIAEEPASPTPAPVSAVDYAAALAGEEASVPMVLTPDQTDTAAAATDDTVPAENAARAPTPVRPRVITVQAGATLWAIARENLGEGTLYVQVFDANRDKISNPDLIYPGQVFAVPAKQQ